MPRPGDFGVTRTGGLPAWVIRAVTRSPVNHAILYLGGVACIEARPSGAGLVNVDAYPDAIWSTMPLTDEQRARIVTCARSHLGVPYNWVDDLAIGLARIFGRALPGFVRRRLARPDRLMCSALVDFSYEEAGVHLFNDGRLSGDVAPSDLLCVITGERDTSPL